MHDGLNIFTGKTKQIYYAKTREINYTQATTQHTSIENKGEFVNFYQFTGMINSIWGRTPFDDVTDMNLNKTLSIIHTSSKNKMADRNIDPIHSQRFFSEKGSRSYTHSPVLEKFVIFN